MKGTFLLNVIVWQGPSIFKLFSSENQTLLIWRNSLLVLNFGLHILDRIRCLNFQGDGFSSQGFDKNLHTTTKPQDQMQSGFFLDVIIRQGPAIFKLFSSENQTLLIWRDSLLVLNLGLHILNGVGSFNLQGDGFSGQGFHENLHSSAKSQDQVKGRFFLDVVVRQGSAIFQLFSSEDKPLLIWRNTFLVLNFGFDIFNTVGSFNLQGNGLSG